MNLPSTSYVSRFKKTSHSWSNSSDKVPFHVARNNGYKQSGKHRSPEINNEDAASVYSDAGDTFASRPSNGTYEDHQDTASVGLYNSAQRSKESDSRDFILKRFLPAAQAMAGTEAKSSVSSSPLPAEKRPPRKSSLSTTTRFGSFSSGTSKSKSRFIHEVKQDVRFEDFEDGSEDMKACGFPVHLGRLTLQHIRFGFWASRANNRSNYKPHDDPVEKDSKKAIDEEATDNSDMFWSDEEGFDDSESQAASGMNERGECSNSSEMRKRLGAEMLHTAPARMHSMETIHTPDHRGFLGLPRAPKLTSGEIEGARQVDRLGARLSRMISKTNYKESRSVSRMNEHDERDLGSSSNGTGPSATTSSSSGEAPRTKWVDAVASLMPPPSPKMPSESWLSNTLPPERLVEVRKLSRKSLGSFIPIKSPLKPTGSNPEDISIRRIQQSCSLKELLEGRQSLRSASTIQAV